MRRGILRSAFICCCLLLSVSFLPVHAQDNPWVEVGMGSASGGGISGMGDVKLPSIATAADNTIYVSWSNIHSWLETDNTARSTSDIYVKRFNGTEWEEVGVGSATTRGISNNPDNDRYDSGSIVKVAPDGTPYVLWEKLGFNGNGPGSFYIKRFNGTSWEEVGVGSASGTGLASLAKMPTMAIAPDGTVYVAWSSPGNGSNSGTAGIYVLRFSGTAWEEVGAGSASCCGGGISQGQGPGNDPVIQVDSNGTPYVVWTCLFYGAHSQICVRRFNDTTWEEVGAGSATFPYGMSATQNISDYPYMAIGPGDLPYIAWAYWNGSNWDIYVKRFNGTVWDDVGTSSASGLGISNTQYTNSIYPRLIFMNDGLPYVFWKEDLRSQPGYNSSDLSIWVRRFNGEIWEEIFPGSASLIGIDGTNDDTEALSVENNVGTTAYMTYNASSLGGKAVYVRRYEFSAANAAPSRNFFTVQPITLTWKPVTWAFQYHIQVDTNNSFKSPFIVDTTVTVPELLLNTLDPHTYSWRVQAVHENGTQGGWSATESFSVGKP